MASHKMSYSIVDYSSDNDGYFCGYCGSPNSNFSHRMCVRSILVQDYQQLLDRGWSRSGQDFYKPTMNLLCCPMYTIKCSVLHFKLTKSQKKIIRKVNRFLVHGERKYEKNGATERHYEADFENYIDISKRNEKKSKLRAQDAEVKSVHESCIDFLTGRIFDSNGCKTTNNTLQVETESKAVSVSQGLHSCEQTTDPRVNMKRISESGVGTNSNDVVCKKAKFLRLERKMQKLQSKGLKEEEIIKKLNKKTAPVEKSLEDLINEPIHENPAHRLQTVLVPVGSEDMCRTLSVSWDLYVKYQVEIHGKDAKVCSYNSFLGFLVLAPVKFEEPNGNGPPSGYGSFHEQYWLDDKLIAVGVLDILPKCVHSVYFYYDPDYRDLSLGTYASLREIALARSLHAYNPSIQDYYMGYYIESSPKMRYKERLKPSFLLCPETYTWQPFESSLRKIQESKYSRLNEDLNAIDSDGIVDVNQVMVLYKHICMNFSVYKTKTKWPQEEIVREYASLVGMSCARRMLLRRK